MLIIIGLKNKDIEINSNFLINQFLFFQYNHNYTLNGVFWTLGIEVQFYFLAPFIIFLVRKYIGNNILKHGIIYSFTLMLPMLMIYFSGDVSELDSRNLIGNFSHFYISFLAYDLIKNRKFKIPKLKFLNLILFISFLFLIYFYYFHAFLFWTLGNFIVDIIIVIILIIHEKLINNSFNFFLLTLFKFIGKISFGIYAYHLIIFRLFTYDQVNIVYILFITLFFSTISYLTFESFFLSFSRKGD
jgi:peptidoglycan/LPS O-acetylase OafA/YrhL